jgi:hypothetical protein
MNDRIEEIKERMRRILASCANSHLTGTPKNETIYTTSGILFRDDGMGGNKSEAMKRVQPTVTTKRLQEALRHKQDELRLRERDLASPCYANDEWTQGQIACLKEQIERINEYLCGGASLSLPRCCASGDFICLIAITGFDSCIMQPDDCGFSLGV